MRHGSLVFVLVALAMALPAQAAAAPVRVARFVPSYAEPYSGTHNPPYSYSAPALAGSDLAWARSAPGGGWVIERGPPGGGGARVATVPRPSEGRNTVHTVRLAGANGHRLAWIDSAFDVLDAHGMSYRSARSRIATAVGLGPAETVVGCDGRDACACPPFCGDHAYPADLDGDILAYVEGNYPNRAVVVDDLTSSEPPVRIEADEIDAYVLLAGDHVAFTQLGLGSEPRTIVYDWRARRELYRLPVRRVRDLQADGKVVTAGAQGRIEWYSAAEPTPHPIAPPAKRHLGDMRMAGDRIAFTHTRRYGADPVLALTDLAGNTRHLGTGPGFGMLAFDGRRAGFMLERCGLVEVLIYSDVDQPGGPAPRSSCVPPRIADLAIDADDQIVVKAVCRAGCRGILGIYAPNGFPVSKLVTRRMNFGPSRRVRTVRLEPSSPAQAALNRHTGPLRINARYLGRDGRGQMVGAARAGTVKRP